MDICYGWIGMGSSMWRFVLGVWWSVDMFYRWVGVSGGCVEIYAL